MVVVVVSFGTGLRLWFVFGFSGVPTAAGVLLFALSVVCPLAGYVAGFLFGSELSQKFLFAVVFRSVAHVVVFWWFVVTL